MGSWSYEFNNQFYMMTWIRWMIPCMAIILESCSTGFHEHTLKICDVDYIVKASIRKHCKKREYRLKVEGPDRPARVLRLGYITNDYSRATLLAALKDSLHKSDLFRPCDGKSGENDRELNRLIKDLIKEPFPYAHDIIVATATIDDNNVLKLLQQSGGGRYQLVLEAPDGVTTLVEYDADNHHYIVSWNTVKDNAYLLKHFDQWLKLYYLIPATAVKPELLMESTAGVDPREIIFRYPGAATDPVPSGIKFPKAVADKISGSPETEIKIGNNAVKVKPVVVPNS